MARVAMERLCRNVVRFEITSRRSQGLTPPEEQVSKAGGASTGSPKLMRTVPGAVSIPCHNAVHSCFCLRAGIPQYAHCPCVQQAKFVVKLQQFIICTGHDKKASTMWAQL